MYFIINEHAQTNTPPTFTPLPSQTIPEGSPLAFITIATDPDGDTLTYSASSLPVGAIYSSSTGAFAWTPAHTDIGTHNILFTATDSGNPSMSATTSITIEVTEVIPEDYSNTALLATNSMWLKIDGRLLSGNAVVHNINASTTQYLSPLAQMVIGKKYMATFGTELTSNSIHLKDNSSVYDVSVSTITGTGNTYGTTNTYTAPFISLPAFQTASTGASDIIAPARQVTTITPGNYDSLEVKRYGILVITAGEYDFTDVLLRKDVQVYFTGPTVIRVANTMQTKANTVIQAFAGDLTDASDLVFYVSGINTDAFQAPAVVRIGEENTLNANIYAPQGRIVVQAGSGVTGSLIGQDISLGKEVTMKVDSAF